MRASEQERLHTRSQGEARVETACLFSSNLSHYLDSSIHFIISLFDKVLQLYLRVFNSFISLKSNSRQYNSGL